jgi:hypothetical protein
MIPHFEVEVENKDASNSHRNKARIVQKKVGNIKVAVKRKKAVEAKLTLNSEVSGNSITLTLPIRTVSELNCSHHWTKKHKRHRLQQKTVALVLNPLKAKISTPCSLHLIRIAPKQLDKHDNLPASLKYIVDACCAIITQDFRPGRADSNDNFQITYDQKISSQYGVKIIITF